MAWDKEALMEEAELQQAQIKLIQNAGINSDPYFVLLKDIVCAKLTNKHYGKIHDILPQAMEDAKAVLEAYNDSL